MFALLERARNLSLSIDILIKLFNVPVVLYGTEVWHSEKCDIIERLQLRFFKYVLSVNKLISSMTVYEELGAIPFDVDNKSRMLTVRVRLYIKYKIYLNLNG